MTHGKYPPARHCCCSRSLSATLAVLVTLGAVGCASEQPATDGAPPEPAEETVGAPLAEVFFASVEDGGTYSSPVQLIFLIEGFDIIPIEDPLVARDGEGHYHLAVDADCAAAGDVIIAGSPSYIHFGNGSDRITMQFDASEHRLCLQVADGEHRVIDGPDHSLLTKEIQITIE